MLMPGLPILRIAEAVLGEGGEDLPHVVHVVLLLSFGKGRFELLVSETFQDLGRRKFGHGTPSGPTKASEEIKALKDVANTRVVPNAREVQDVSGPKVPVTEPKIYASS